MNDALANPVKLGSLYGYSSINSSWVTIVVGKAVKFTQRGVTLEVVKRHTYLYSNPSDYDRHDSKTVNVRSMLLFPVTEDGARIETHQSPA